MGCDIHSVIQVKDHWRAGWRTVACDVGDDRNYDTFAVYANVRNGLGFAGLKTGETWEPIAEPRGFPDDFIVGSEPDERVSNMAGTWMGDHSQSWLLFSELKKKWKELDGALHRVSGILERAHWEKTLKVGELPSEWCGGISGGGVLVVEQSAAPHVSDFTHVSCSWDVRAHDCLHTMRNHMALMQGIQEASHITDQEVRIVFGFDS